MDKLSELLPYLAGATISLYFAYAPGAKERFDALDSRGKRLVMFGSIVLVGLAYFGVACAPLLAAKLGVSLACSADSAVDVAIVIGKLFVANQLSYVAFVKKD